MTYPEYGAQPSSTDLPGNFFRNLGTFPKRYIQVIPVDYAYAERYDGVQNGVPRASYYRLTTASEGQPISERVASSLQNEFSRDIKIGSNGRDKKTSQVRLDWARTSLEEDNWTAAIQHASEAFNLGRAREKKSALKLVSKIMSTIRENSNLAPARERNTIKLYGWNEVTVPAALNKLQDIRYWAWK